MSDIVHIPLLNLKRAYESIREKVEPAIAKVLQSGQYINGPSVGEFEEAWARYNTVEHAVGVSNGTDALQLALEAVGVGRGDDVLLQGNAYIADALMIDAVGANIVFVDQDDTFQLPSVDAVEKAITPKTKCILVVHMYGMCCDMSALSDLCRRLGLALVEDCAHAHGASWQGKMLGSFGDVACWSFYPGKTLGAFGDAGACATNDADIAKKLRLLKNSGSNRKYFHDTTGRNCRLDTIQAAVLLVKLPELEFGNRRRREIAETYRTHLAGVGDIGFVSVRDGCLPAYHQFVITTGTRERRDCLAAYLKDERKIGVVIHYPVPIHRQKPFAIHGINAETKLPKSDYWCDRIMSLPMDPLLTSEEILAVVAAVKDFFALPSQAASLRGDQSAVPDSAAIAASKSIGLDKLPASKAVLLTCSNPGNIVRSVNGKKSSQQPEEGSVTLLSDPLVDSVATSGLSAITEYQCKIRDVKVGRGVKIVRPCNIYSAVLKDDSFVGPFVEIQASVSIGCRTRVQSHSFICEDVKIGNDCFIGHGVMFINDLLKGRSLRREDREHAFLPTTIGDGVAIGSNATILPVTICDDVVIGAGAVVTKDITRSGVYAGNPAQRIADFDYS